MRQVPSYLDDTSGYSSPKSPYEYDGSPTRATPNNFTSRPPGSAYGDGLARQQRRYEPIPARKDYTPPMAIPPRSVARNVKRPRLAPEVPEIPESDEASKGLVPIGDSGFYGTPDEAASPSDCDRWPNSPACGKNPFTNVPVGFEDVTVIKDECNQGIRITPVLGFTKLPDVELVYRNKECRINPPDTSGRAEWDVYELPPSLTSIPLPPRRHKCIPIGDDVICYVGVQLQERSLIRTFDVGNIHSDTMSQSASKDSARMLPPKVGVPITYQVRSNPAITYQKIPLITCEVEYSFESQNYSAEWNIPPRFGIGTSRETNSQNNQKRKSIIYADPTIDLAYLDSEGSITTGRGRDFFYDFNYNIKRFATGFGGYNCEIIYGQYKQITAYLESLSIPNIIIDSFTRGGSQRFESRKRFDTSPQVVWIMIDGEVIIPPPCVKKPPEPKKKKRCCMGCCPPSKNDDDKWKLIIQKLNKLQKDVDDVQKNIGEPEHLQYHEEKNTEVLKDYGFHRKSEKPDTLFKTFKFINERVNTIQLWGQRVKEAWHVLQPREFIDAKIPKKLIYPGATGQEKVRGYADVGQVQIRQSDKSAGGWPIRIKVADANPGKKGNQPVVMEVNSVADALRLLLESVIETGGDVDTHTNMMVRSLYMQAQTLQVTSVCEQYLENIEEWLDYPVEQFKLPVPMTISPLAQPAKGFEQTVGQGLDNNTEAETEKLLPHLLQETHQNIRATRFKGGRTLNERLLEMFHHISVVSGTNSTRYQGIPALKTLIEAAVAARKMHGFLDRENLRDALSSGDTDVILKEIEQGYETSAPERKEVKSPYNKPQNERPRVKRVSKKRKPPTK